MTRYYAIIRGDLHVIQTMANIGDLPAEQAARAIIEVCGERASGYASDQIELCHNQPDQARHWRAIAAAITALTQAHVHMEIALDLMDTAGSIPASAHLDAAISSLGVRRDDTVRVLIGEANPEQAERYYGERVDQHLTLAGRADDPAVKGLHLDIASRYATLRQLATTAPGLTDQADGSSGGTVMTSPATRSGPTP